VGAGVGVGAGTAASLLSGAHDKFLSTLNTADVAFVATQSGYLVRVRTAHAVTCEQSHLTIGYNVAVSPPIEMATGILIVAVVGMF